MKFLKLSLAIYTTVTIVLVHGSLAQISPEEIVEQHNKARAYVEVVPISWNSTLAAQAQERANRRITNCRLFQDIFDENLATAPYPVTGAKVVKWWADEKPFYDYKLNACVGGQNCYHYVLVVWNRSTEVGCVRAQCNNGRWFISCLYYPPSRRMLERPY